MNKNQKSKAPDAPKAPAAASRPKTVTVTRPADAKATVVFPDESKLRIERELDVLVELALEQLDVTTSDGYERWSKALAVDDPDNSGRVFAQLHLDDEVTAQLHLDGVGHQLTGEEFATLVVVGLKKVFTEAAADLSARAGGTETSASAG